MGIPKKKWEVVGKVKPQKEEEIIKTLLVNRGLTIKKDQDTFFEPVNPQDLTLTQLGVKSAEVKKTIGRLKQAKADSQSMVIYGDYDADGICATAILWEALYKLGFKVMPYIPERFSEGYGISVASVGQLKAKDKNLAVVISVDNGIVANQEITEINKLGIDVIVLDHHLKGKSVPHAFGIIHTPEVCAAAIAWLFSREVGKSSGGLDLVGMATIADQMSLIGPNRSFAKWGLAALKQTLRPGLKALYREAGLEPALIGSYAVGYLIAPRINAMGRLAHGLDSLRLLCTGDTKRAEALAQQLGQTNQERQRVVDQVILHARGQVEKAGSGKVIILAHESYHEGVIGLAAGKLVEEFYRPAIVLSKGKDISKASARSISGLSIIEVIRKLDYLIEGGGGHPMAAGFSIKTEKIEEFALKFNQEVDNLLTDDMLAPKLKIDVEIDFGLITEKLVKTLQQFEPFGLGNPAPTFLVKQVRVLQSKAVGAGKHLKLVLKNHDRVFEAIAFGRGELLSSLNSDSDMDIVFNLEENTWNGNTEIQLKVKDIINSV